MRPARERRLAGPRRPGKAARGALAAGEPPVLPGPPAGGFPGVLPLAGRGKFALTRVKPRSTLSSNRGSWALTSRLSRERRAVSVVIRRGHAAPRTGPQQRPGAATVGRGGGANGRQGRRRLGAGYAAGSAWPLPGRLRQPAWPAHRRRSGRPPLREERPEAAVPALPPGKGGAAAARAVSTDHNSPGARRKRGVE